LHKGVGLARVNVEVFNSMFRALRAIGTQMHNHSLNRKRQEQSPIRREATKVSGQEMETQKRAVTVPGVASLHAKALARRE